MSCIEYWTPEGHSEHIVRECGYYETFRSEGDGLYEYWQDGVLIRKYRFSNKKFVSKTDYNGETIQCELVNMYVEFNRKRLVKATCHLKDSSVTWEDGRGWREEKKYSDEHKEELPPPPRLERGNQGLRVLYRREQEHEHEQEQEQEEELNSDEEYDVD